MRLRNVPPPFCKSCFVDFEFSDIYYATVQGYPLSYKALCCGVWHEKKHLISQRPIWTSIFRLAFVDAGNENSKAFGLASNLQILRLQKTLIYITAIMLQFLALLTCVCFHFCKRSRTFLLTSATSCGRRVCLAKVLDSHENTTPGICLYPKGVPRKEK